MQFSTEQLEQPGDVDFDWSGIGAAIVSVADAAARQGLQVVNALTGEGVAADRTVDLLDAIAGHARRTGA